MKPAAKISEVIIESLKNGDMAAFDIIYRAYCKRLYKFVFGIIKTESDAEEIVQEVFVKIWEARGNIDDLALFDSYLFTIAYNSTISLIRKKMSEEKYIQHVKSLQVPLQNKLSDDDLDFESVSARINELVDKLPPRQKEVFKLHREHELTYRQIAEKLQISINTVENHMSKALKFLRNNLKRESLAAIMFFYLYL
ncbi:MAG: RNA polymerase sigma-70 factor [Spirochaetes bacterium]|jgi:RNA polymerase sigma-70 factor (ECF subfamily)|nr:RNA polymerase sigma-70 factor [Spirochaetota bacterium]